MSEEILLPASGESAAIADKVKTAALCYDRVWCPPENVFGWGEEFPATVRFFGGTNAERTISFDLENKSINTFPSMKKLFESPQGLEIIKGSTLGLMADILRFSDSKEGVEKVFERADKIQPSEQQGFIDNTNVIMDLINRDIAKAFCTKYKIAVATVYSTKRNQRLTYSGGDKTAIVTSLDNLGIVDEKKITWEQVLEFRKDEEAQRKYRRFLHWLDKEMVEKSQAFVEDEISQRLEDYEWALKKHSIKTLLGTIEEALDGKYLIGAGGLALAGHPILGMLGAGLLIGGKLAVKLVQTKMDFDDIERGPNAEISWVYEVKELGK